MSRRLVLALAFGLAACSLPGDVSALDYPIDLRLARQYFDETAALCQQDHGLLWGRSLCAPVMFADPQTRCFVADVPDSAGLFQKVDGVYIGTLPKDKGIANSAIEWAGKRWTILMWPLPEDRYERARLLMHESFHNIEKDLPLNMRNPDNAHLDTHEGRFWLQMEWHALREALMNQGGEYRREAMRDALLFRSYRHRLFPRGEAQECQGEMHEGLAEYTGDALSGSSQRQRERQIACRLEKAKKSDTFVSTFYYWSGAAYGTLLDASGINWRKGIKAGSDFGRLLQKAYALRLLPVTAAEAEQRMHTYEGVMVRADEDRREALRAQRLDGYRRLFVMGPVLEIPVGHISFTYDPSGLVPLDSLGTIYPTMNISGDWGNLGVTGGSLISRNWKKISLPAPPNPGIRPVTGPGWTLELKDGWALKPGPRRGDFVLRGPPR